MYMNILIGNRFHVALQVLSLNLIPIEVNMISRLTMDSVIGWMMQEHAPPKVEGWVRFPVGWYRSFENRYLLPM